MVSDNNDRPYIDAITQVLRGDSSAYRLIVHDFQEEIYRIALTFLRDPEEAEDATQEIFLRVYKSLHKFRLDRQFQPWLFTIASNYLKNSYRNKKKKKAKEQKLPDFPLASPRKERDTWEEKEEIELVRKAISDLPGTLKEAVILYYLEDMDVKSIAKELDLTEENIKSRLHRARKKLKKHPSMRNYFDSEG